MCYKEGVVECKGAFLLIFFVTSFFGGGFAASLPEEALTFWGNTHQNSFETHVPTLPVHHERVLTKLCSSRYMRRLARILINSDAWLRPMRGVTFLSASLEYARFIGHAGGGLASIIAALLMHITVPALHKVTAPVMPKDNIFSIPCTSFVSPVKSFIGFDFLREDILHEVQNVMVNTNNFAYFNGCFLNAYESMREPLEERISIYKKQPVTLFNFPFSNGRLPLKIMFCHLRGRHKIAVHSFDVCTALLLSSVHTSLSFSCQVASSPIAPWISFVDKETYAWISVVVKEFSNIHAQRVFSYYHNKIIEKGMFASIKKQQTDLDDKLLLKVLLKK